MAARLTRLVLVGLAAAAAIAAAAATRRRRRQPSVHGTWDPA